MDAITENAIKYLRENNPRYRQDFYGEHLTHPRRIQAIKQLREDLNIGLLPAKNAIEAWEAEWKPAVLMPEAEAKILLKNFLLRGGQSGMTSLEVEAIRRLMM